MEENSNGNEEKLDSEVGEIRAENQEEAEVSPDEGKIATQNLEEDEVASENGEVISEKIETTGGRVIEVPAKKIVLGGKVLTVSLRKDIDAVAGEKLTPEQIKERLIVAIKENGEKIIEDPTIDTPVGPPIVPPIEPTTEEKKEEEKEEKKVSKFKPKYLIPILIPVILALLAQSCHSFGNRKPTVEEIHVPIDAIVYNVDNPGELTYNIRQELGQEGMTANGIEGSSFRGEYYDWEEQAEVEKETSDETILIEDVKKQIETNMQIFIDENATQEQRYQAAKKLLELHTVIEQKFIENQAEVEQYSQETIDALEAYPDENTEAEKKVVEYNIEEYMQELGLAEFNVDEISQIVALMEAGYEITIESEKELDGDYQITGDAVKTIVKDREPGKLQSAWNKLVKFVRGEQEKGIEK